MPYIPQCGQPVDRMAFKDRFSRPNISYPSLKATFSRGFLHCQTYGIHLPNVQCQRMPRLTLNLQQPCCMAAHSAWNCTDYCYHWGATGGYWKSSPTTYFPHFKRRLKGQSVLNRVVPAMRTDSTGVPPPQAFCSLTTSLASA